MKQKKGKRLLSLVLSLVMVLGLLPVAAFAVQNGDCVKVDDGVELGGFSQKFYYDCATKTVCDTVPESGSYAHFIRDYSGGSVNVLELCNYTGGAIQYDSSNKRDWQINLIGENTITVEADGSVQGILSCKDLHIFGDRAGAKLTVNAKTTSTDKNKWAVGIFMMYESDLIIGGYADVTVNVEGETQVTGVGSVHSNYLGSSFGGGVTLQGNASLKIDCAVRFSQTFLSTACIYARSLNVNTKGDLTATIAPTNSEDTFGCYSVSVTYATLDYVRKMTVKGTMTKVQKSNHGSINGFDSSSDGKIRFDEDVLAYNCTSDNVAQWRGNSGEKPDTLTVQGGNIKDMGTSTGRFFWADKVQISCWTDYVPEFEGAQFRRWYRITDDGKRVPFYEGSDSTCYYYISDGEGGDSTLWADINVYKSAFSYINNKNYSRISFSSVSDSIRLYDYCLVKNGGNADNPDDVIITTGNLYFGSQFTKDQLPEGIYQVASKVNTGYETLNPWFYSDPFAVFYSTFVTQPRHDGDTGVLTFRLNAYLRSGSGAPRPQVDIVEYYNQSNVVVENVKSGDAVTTLTAGQRYLLHINVYGQDYYSDPFEAQTVAERVFASAPTVTPDETNPFIYANLSYALQEGVTPYRWRLVNVNNPDEAVLTSMNFQTTTIRMSRIQVPEGIYRLEVQLRNDGVWYAHPSEIRVIYSPWGNSPEVDSGSGAWTDTPHYDSLTGLLSYEPNENARLNVGSWQNQMLERLADDGETWEQVGVATNMAAGFAMSGLPNGIYRLKAVYDDAIEPYEYYSQPFAAFTHSFKSITTGSYNNETDVWIKAQLWEDAFDIIGDERSTTYFSLCKPDGSAGGSVFLGSADDEGMVIRFTAASNIRSAFNLTEEATGVDCRIGFTYGGRQFYSDEFRLDFRTPASFDRRYNTESGGPYRLRSAVKGDQYYQELYFDGARDDLTVTWNEEKPDWLTIRISDEVSPAGCNIVVLEGTPTESGSMVNLTITVSNVSGSDTSSFRFALNTDLTLSPASGSTFIDTLTVNASGIAESDAAYYYTYSIGEDSEPMQPYAGYQYQGTIDPNWGEDLAFTTDLEAGEVVKIKVVAYSPEAGYIGGTAYAEYTKAAAPAAPTASRASGIFGSEFDLKLSCSTGGDTVILYTIDGSDPTDPASTRYSYGTCDNDGLYVEEKDEEGNVVRVYHHQYVEGKYVYLDGNPFPVGRGAEVGDTITIKAVTYMAGWNEDYTAYELSNPSEVATFTYTKANGFKVSGTATSAGSDTDPVTIQLIPKGYSEAAHETTVNGNTAGYSIPGVADGTYTMKVMKNNHVTREYTVTVSGGDATQDVKIHLKGDINGDGIVNTSDNTLMMRHIKQTKLLTGYNFLAADINGDGIVNTSDNTSENVSGTQFCLNIPTGMTYVAGSGKIDPNLKATLNNAANEIGEVSYTESLKMFIANTGALEGLNNLSGGVTFGTFQCTVDASASGSIVVGLNIEVLDDGDVNPYPSTAYTVKTTSITVTPAPKPATGISLDKSTLELTVGESETLVATVEPADTTDTVTWDTGRSDIATVDSTGKVTAVAPGTAVIAARAGEKSAFCTVTVVAAPCTHTNKTNVDAQSSTCKVQGWDAYSKCNDCEQLFDAEGNKISEIPYLSLADHTPTQTATAEYLKSAATCTSPAVYYEHCSVCEVTLSTTFTSGSALGHDYTQKFEDAAHLKTAASKCTEYNVYWFACSRCDANAKDDAAATDKYYTSTTAGAHSFTEQIADEDHQVAGTGTDCQSVKKYYYDCAYCDQMGTTTWDSTAYGPHDYATTWSSDADGHWHECSLCHDKKDGAAHTPNIAAPTETQAKVCTECGYVIAAALGHTHIATGDWQHNTSYHWKVCATCGEKVEKARHDYGTDRTCDICDYVKPKNNNSTTPSQPADTTTKSADTGDMGIALYAGMTILSLTGGAWVVNKKRKGK